MANGRSFNTPHMYEAEPDQQWNRLHSEEVYLHYVRNNSSESGPTFNRTENESVDRVHYASHWNTNVVSNGYSSSTQMVNPPHHHPDWSGPTRDPLHQSAGPIVGPVPENHPHYASSSHCGAESNLVDLAVANRRGSYKRKSPGIPSISERGDTSRYYFSGSSSDISSTSEKTTLEGPHNRWEPLTAPPSYRASHLPIGGEASVKNVRSRSSPDLESDAYRNHLRGYHSHHPSSSRQPVDLPGFLDQSNHNASFSLPQRTSVHLSSGSHGRIHPTNIDHQSSYYFGGSSVSLTPEEQSGYHHEHISGGNSVVLPSTRSIPSHTRGIRSSYTHRSTPDGRGSSGNVQIGHTVPPNEVPQLVGESHSSRYFRPMGPSGWRNDDRNGRSRSSERYHFFSEDASSHGNLTHAGLIIVDRSLYGSSNTLDYHRDMQLDVDNMSYEELLALGERIGSVSTGVSKDQFHKCLTETVYCSSDQMQEEGKCVICLEEYQHMDDVGTLKACGHDYHVECIKKWLSMKNSCPICKGPAVPDNVDGK